MKAQLMGKDYYLVRYGKESSGVGGVAYFSVGYCVFVDAQTGGILYSPTGDQGRLSAVYPPPSKVFPLSKVVTTLIRTVQAD
jgi:hypothetical protein